MTEWKWQFSIKLPTGNEYFLFYNEKESKGWNLRVNTEKIWVELQFQNVSCRFMNIFLSYDEIDSDLFHIGICYDIDDYGYEDFFTIVMTKMINMMMMALWSNFYDW